MDVAYSLEEVLYDATKMCERMDLNTRPQVGPEKEILLFSLEVL